MSKTMDMAAVALGVGGYVLGKRHEDDRFGVCSLLGAALAAYGLSHINSRYAGYLAAAYVGSEVFLPSQVKILTAGPGFWYVGAPGQDYSFTRRPGYNDKNY
jgi:hypothetical protein